MVTWRLNISTLAEGWGAKKRFQHCVKPNSSNQFLYLQAVQGHSGDNAVDPALQDNAQLPKGFTEYIYHVGNASKLNPTKRRGLTPRGTSLKRGRQAVFFTTVNPMGDVYGMEETPCDLTKPRIAPCKNTWKRLQNTVFSCNLKLGLEKSFQFHQTRSHAVVLYNTLPAYWEIEIICCSCGRNVKSTRSPTEFDQNNRDVTSIPGYVIKENSSHEVKHGPSERQKMHYQARPMLEKARQGKHGRHPTILSRWYADNVSHRVEKNTTQRCTTDSPWRSTSTPQQELREFKIRSILTLNADGGTQHSLNQRPEFAQAKRESKRLHDELLARTQEEDRTFPRSQQIRQRKGQQFEGNERIWLRGWPWNRSEVLQRVAGNLQAISSGSRDNLQTASSSSSTWDQTHWKTSNWNSQHSSSPDDWWFFSELGQVSVAWRKTSSQPTGGCEHCTHKHSTYRVAQHDHIFITRTSVAQELEGSGLHIFVLKTIVIHVSCLVLCRTWHRPQAQVLSPISSTSPTFPTVSPLHTSPMILDPYIPCDVPRHSGGSTQIPSLTSYEPKSFENKAFNTEAIAWRPLAQKNWAWQESWDRSVSITGNIYEKTPLLKIWTNLEKLVQRCPTSSHRSIPLMTQRRALQTRILKMENHEKCWLHHFRCKVEKTVNPLECQSQRETCCIVTGEEQVQSVLKLI